MHSNSIQVNSILFKVIYNLSTLKVIIIIIELNNTTERVVFHTLLQETYYHWNETCFKIHAPQTSRLFMKIQTFLT